jgi:hypothetical protein
MSKLWTDIAWEDIIVPTLEISSTTVATKWSTSSDMEDLTKWLARNLKRARYVAVKVVTADTSDDLNESILMKNLYDGPSEPGLQRDHSNPRRRIARTWYTGYGLGSTGAR